MFWPTLPAPSLDFAFLATYDPLLAPLPTLAERYFADDPSTNAPTIGSFECANTPVVAPNRGRRVTEHADRNGR